MNTAARLAEAAKRGHLALLVGQLTSDADSPCCRQDGLSSSGHLASRLAGQGQGHLSRKGECPSPSPVIGEAGRMNQDY
jgi:hypothetical protein